MRKHLMKRLVIFLTVLSLGGCSLIDEGDCYTEYILYQYRNNIGLDATEQIYKMTDFIFTKDSVLYRVDDGIMNSKMRKRPINLPDGDWIIVTYGNLMSASNINYTIGQSKYSDLSLRVISQPTYTGTYATYSVNEKLKLGNSDRLYFGKADVKVRGGYTDRLQMVDLSNVHIRIGFTVVWKDASRAPTRADGDNLHARLDYVPVEFHFAHDERNDELYQILYRTPRRTNEIASFLTSMEGGTTPNQFFFEIYGLRWETGKAPVLKLYDGENLLVNKELDLNRYFNDQRIDLTNVRVQFFNLKVEVGDNSVIIFPIGVESWEDGGVIGNTSRI